MDHLKHSTPRLGAVPPSHHVAAAALANCRAFISNSSCGHAAAAATHSETPPSPLPLQPDAAFSSAATAKCRPLLCRCSRHCLALHSAAAGVTARRH